MEKIKHILGLYSNKVLYPDYPTYNDVLFRLKNDHNIKNKKIKVSDLDYYIETSDIEKRESILLDLIENNIIEEKKIKDKIFYVVTVKLFE